MKYGENKIVLMIRDPRWLFAFWEISEEKKAKLVLEAGETGWRDGTLLLRLYDVTNILFNGFNAHSSYDTEVNEYSNNWYIRAPMPNRNYLVDLLLRTPDNRFFVVCRSNTVKVSDRNMAGGNLQKDQSLDFETIFKLSGGGDLPEALNSLKQLVQGKREEPARSVPRCWEYKKMILCNYCVYHFQQDDTASEAAGMRCWEFKSKYPSEISCPLKCNECDYFGKYSKQ